MITATRRASLTRHHNLSQGAAPTPLDVAGITIGAGAHQPLDRLTLTARPYAQPGGTRPPVTGPCVTVPADDP